MSAGQQQRVVIARALINDPEVLFADEPSSDLDEQTETEIMDAVRRHPPATRRLHLMVTHASELIRYGTRAVEMAGGRMRELN